MRPLTIRERTRTIEGGHHGIVRVVFNQPVRGLGAAEDVALGLDPNVAGTSRWWGADTLVYEPEQPLPRGLLLEARIRGEFPGGLTLPDAERAWSVTTGGPELSMRAQKPDDVFWADEDLVPGAFVVVSSEQHVALDAFRERLTARTEAGVRVELVAESVPPSDGEGCRFHVKPASAWPPGETVTIGVAAGLKALDSQAPTEIDVEESFSVVPPLRIDQPGAEVDGSFAFAALRGLQSISLSVAIGPEQLAFIDVRPRPKGFRATAPDWVGAGKASEEVLLHGDFRTGQSYQITFSPRLRDVYGRRPERRAYRMVLRRHAPEVALHERVGILRPGAPQTVEIHGWDVAELEVRVSPLGDELVSLWSALEAPTSEDGASTQLPALPTPRWTRLVRPQLDAEGWFSEVVDLAAISGGKQGAVAVEVRPLAVARGERPEASVGAYQLTDLAAVAVAGPGNKVVWAHALGSGEPAAHVMVSASPDASGDFSAVGETDTHGLLLRDERGWSGGYEWLRLHDRATDHVAYVPLGLSTELAHDPGAPLPFGEEAFLQFQTERDVYAPGESVSLVGFLGVRSAHVPLGLRNPAAATPVAVALVLSGETVSRTLRSDAQGKFFGSIPIPEDAAPRRATIKISALGAEQETELDIAHFREPSFVTELTCGTERPTRGQAMTWSLHTEFYGGGDAPLDHAEIRASCQPTRFRPPGVPWDFEVLSRPPRKSGEQALRVDRRDVDAGAARFRMEPPVEGQRGPFACEVTATAVMADGEVARDTQGFTVHDGPYIAYRLERDRVSVGEELAVELRATDEKGEPADAHVSVTHVDSQSPARSCTPRFVQGRASCRFKAKHLGAQTLSVAMAGHETRELYAGAGALRETEEQRDPGEPVLTVSQAEMGKPQDVTILGGERNTHGLFVQFAAGIEHVSPLDLSHGEVRTSLLVDESWAARAHLYVLAHRRPAEDELPKVFAQGKAVSISAEHRRLSVRIRAPEVARPGDTLPVDVEVRGHDGADVSSDVALWAVDEAVLALSPWPDRAPPDWVAPYAQKPRFRPYRRDSEAWTRHAGKTHPPGGGGSGSGYGRGAGGFRGRDAASLVLDERANFRPTAFFIGSAKTGRDGKLHVDASLPDNLTRFRVVAVASAPLEGLDVAGRFGAIDTAVQTRLPVSVRVRTPAIVRPGDAFSLTAIVQNLSGAPRKLVARPDRSGAAIELLDDHPSALSLADGERVIVRWSARAVREGPATVRIAVRAEDETPLDVERRALRVIAPRVPTHVEAHYGVLAAGEASAIEVRLTEREARAGGVLRVHAAHESHIDLSAASRALVDYPYGCAEQTASRLLALSREKDPAALARWIERLGAMQMKGGGFGLWPGAREPRPFVTAYAAWALSRLDAAVAEPMLTRSLDYLAELWTSQHASLVERAAAAFALAEAGRPLPAEGVRALQAELERVGGSHAAELYFQLALQRSGTRSPAASFQHLVDALDERQGRALLPAFQPQQALLLESHVRDSALLLLGLLRSDPQHPAVRKLVRGLLDARRDGQWRTTQEDAHALVALGAFVDAQPPAAGSPGLRCWLDDRYAGDTRESPCNMPLSHERSVLVLKAEAGQLAFQATKVTPAPAAAVSHGMTLERTIVDANGNAVTSSSPGEPAALLIRLASPGHLYDVVVDVPTPAGVRISRRQVDGRSDRLVGADDWRILHREIDDGGARLFFEHLPPGQFAWRLPLRAQSAGTYGWPAAKAEMMYYPETFATTEPGSFSVVLP